MVVEAREFRGMFFDVFERESALDCPRLATVQGAEDVDGPFSDQVLRALCYIYDSSSPLARTYPDIALRKVHSCQVAGFDPDNELHQDFVAAIRDLDSEVLGFDAPALITRMLRAQDAQLWSLIVSAEESFYEYQQILITPSGAMEEKDLMLAIDRKSKLHKICRQLADDLKAYRREFFRGDEDLEASLRGSRFTPEAVAKARRV